MRKNILTNFKEKTRGIKLKSKKTLIFLTSLLIILVIPLLTIQPFNQPFDKLALRLQRPPKLDKVSQQNSSSVLSAQTGKIKYPDDYTIILLGDSMTERLGNSDELRGYLSQYYPKKTFEVLNYGYGATNILSVKDRLIRNTDHFRDYRPITDIDFDLIIIESFGNNPLSQYPLEQGLHIQNQTLDETIQILKLRNPRGKIAFLATVAPNKENYAKSTRDLSDQVRKEWVAERTAYIKNHIKYAKEHDIPLINVYKDSQDFFGDGKMIFIDDKDFIHPSPLGIIFISKKIAEQIDRQSLLPE